MPVLFCPFCRDAFEDVEVCPEHTLALVPFQRLPTRGPENPSSPMLPPWEFRFGRGWVAAGALLTLLGFFFPLAELTGQIQASSTLVELATGRAKTLWLVPMTATAMLVLLVRHRQASRLRSLRLAVLWLALLGAAVVGLTLLGAHDAAAMLDAQTAGEVQLRTGAGCWLVGVGAACATWGAFHLGRAPRPVLARVRIVE